MSIFQLPPDIWGIISPNLKVEDIIALNKTCSQVKALGKYPIRFSVQVLGVNYEVDLNLRKQGIAHSKTSKVCYLDNKLHGWMTRWREDIFFKEYIPFCNGLRNGVGVIETNKTITHKFYSHDVLEGMIVYYNQPDQTIKRITKIKGKKETTLFYYSNGKFKLEKTIEGEKLKRFIPRSY